MPYLPGWMADAMENLLPSKFFDAEVNATAYITPEILKVRFAADLQHIDFYPGRALMVRVGTNDLRHYTVSSFNPEADLFEILFHIHGNGPGSNLAATLRVGEQLKMAVPGGRKMYVPEKEHHFFFGDETSLSFVLIVAEEIRKNGGTYKGIAELRSQNSPVPELLGLDVMTVEQTPETPGLQAVNYLQELSGSTVWENAVFYLTGNVSSVQAFRKELKKLGVSSKNIKFQGYWVEGSVGL